MLSNQSFFFFTIGVVSTGITSLSPTVTVTGGQNVLMLSYTLLINYTTMETGTTYTSAATIGGYRAAQGGTDFVVSLGLVVQVCC